MKRLLFFSYYNPSNHLTDYVVYLLQAIKCIYTRIIFISNSTFNKNDLQKLNGLYDDIIFRENRDSYFGAWKDAIMKEGWDSLAEYNSITLMNDTCFGPLFNLYDVYLKMEKQNIGFWGLTSFYRFSQKIWKKQSISEYIQSYFICFNKEVVSSVVFQRFWTKLKCSSDHEQMITSHEIKLTTVLFKSGFKYMTLYNQTSKNTITSENISIFQPYLIVQNNIPFLKIDAFIHFDYQKYLIKLLREKTDYPVELIYKYITDTFVPNIALQICDKSISAVPLSGNQENTLKIAIHLHVFYLDVAVKYLDFFNTMNIAFDLFITTDTAEKKNYITSYISNTKIEKQTKQIIVFENRGRDILPWLNISDLLKKYDVAGHFHTKKTSGLDKWIGETWLDDVFELLLIPFNKIANEFDVNQELGVIIPDIPMYKILYPHIMDKHTHNYFSYSLNSLWRRIKAKKSINFKKLETFIFPYGSMFFYRPKALDSLFELNFSSKDFPPEPLKKDLTLAHCIERIPVYVAWNNNYDFRIMTFSPPKINQFDNHLNLSKRVIGSFTYRAGNFILRIPKLIKRLINSK